MRFLALPAQKRTAFFRACKPQPKCNPKIDRRMGFQGCQGCGVHLPSSLGHGAFPEAKKRTGVKIVKTSQQVGGGLFHCWQLSRIDPNAVNLSQGGPAVIGTIKKGHTLATGQHTEYIEGTTLCSNVSTNPATCRI